MALRTRNAVLLAKMETTPGTDAVPSAATDAVLIEVTGNPIRFNPEITAGKVATLADTMSAEIIATTNYRIPANVLYRPGSVSIPALTIDLYMDGLLHKFVGCRGNVVTNLRAGSAGKLT